MKENMMNKYFWGFMILALLVGFGVGMIFSNAVVTGRAFPTYEDSSISAASSPGVVGGIIGGVRKPGGGSGGDDGADEDGSNEEDDGSYTDFNEPSEGKECDLSNNIACGNGVCYECGSDFKWHKATNQDKPCTEDNYGPCTWTSDEENPEPVEYLS